MLRRRLSKKGQVASQTALAAFAIAVLIVFLVVFKIATSVVHAQDIVQACHLSTILSSWELRKDIWVTNLNLMDSPFSLDCQTLFTEITEDGINRAEFPITFGKDAKPEQKKDKLKDAIMQEMKQCWYMYGEGRAKVQQDVETEGGKTTCIVCSEIIPTKEFVEQMQEDSSDVLKLDEMYAYAASNKDPQRDKYYLDYLLENAKTKPNVLPEGETPKPGVKYVEEPVIDLTKRYSVVFAVADQTEKLSALLGKGGVIKADTGIVGCYLGGDEYKDKNPATGDFAKAIGCNEDGKNENGLIFGKVIDGGKHDELLSWKSFVPLGGAVGVGGSELKRFPMTVRLVPTEDMVKGDFCSRLY